jgi:hypothetical protein
LAIWYILWTLGNLVAIRYIFPRFGILCQEKSGNPARDAGFSALKNDSMHSADEVGLGEKAAA